MHCSAAQPTTDLTAYDFYLRGLATFYPITRERIFEALRLLERAIAIDPHYAPALSWAAMCHREIATSGSAEAPDASCRKARDLARQALQAAENDPRVLANAALVLAHFGDDIGEDLGAMIGLIDRALTAVRDGACDRASSVHINQLLKSGLGHVSSRTRFLAMTKKKYIYGVKLNTIAEDILSPRENLRKLTVVFDCIRRLSDPCGDIRVVTFYPIVPAPSQILV